MVRKAFDSTVTSSDFYTVFDNVVATNPQLNKIITDVRNESNLFLVRVLRFYTHRDMAFVEEMNTGERYYCYLTHEMLSYEVSLNCMCDGTVESDTNYGTYVKPFSRIYGIVADVRFKGNIDEKCLLACLNYDNDNQLKSNVRNGEIKLVSGESTLSIDRNRINLTTPRLFVNGLPYDEPKLSNYYDKTEVDIIKSNTDAQIEELDDVVKNLDIKDMATIVDVIYPVGSIYMSINNTNPSLLFGGEWVQLKDTFLLACGDTYSADDSDKSTAQHGSADAIVVSHDHTQDSHTHTTTNNYVGIGSSANWSYGTKVQMSYTSGSRYYPHSDTDEGGIAERNTMSSIAPTINSKGESGTGKNMPPYLSVYMWKRTG